LSPETTEVIITAPGSVDRAVEAMLEGATDFIAKPFSMAQLVVRLSNVCSVRILREQNVRLQAQLEQRHSFSNIIGKSKPMQEVFELIRLVADSDASVIVTGESGTGKELLAKAIHLASPRRENPFIAINCGAMPENLLESELFGFEKGAFTGADAARAGRFEQASGGTLFLDEVAELALPVQAKLLRVLEEKSFERVGGNRTITSDVRIIAATNRKPEDQVSEGSFREDLYYRLNVLRVHIPPLRERHECIEPLSDYLLDKICRNLKKKINGFTPQVLGAFKSYSWPGNIRQLANTIERAAILEETALIELQHVILPDFKKIPSLSDDALTQRPAESLADKEKETILAALEECLWIQKDAARKLGITPRALNYKVKKFNITHARWRKNK